MAEVKKTTTAAKKPVAKKAPAKAAAKPAAKKPAAKPAPKAAAKKPAVKKAPVKKAPAKKAAPKAKVEKQAKDLAARKSFTGTVVSTVRDKTISVAVETYIMHPLYHKRFRKIKKFQVHDERNEAGMNDKVLIKETRPMSKTKTFRLDKIVTKAKDGE